MRELIVKRPTPILRQLLYDVYTWQCIQQLLIRIEENKKMKMRYWHIVIKYEGKLLTTTIKAVYHYDAYLEVQKKYPGCVIRQISEMKL